MTGPLEGKGSTEVLPSERSPRWRRALPLAWLGVAGALVYLGVRGPRWQISPTDLDFPVFFEAARLAWSGGDPSSAMIPTSEGEAWYLYPPFLAVVFGVFLPLGLTLASHAWLVVNLALLAWCVRTAGREIERRLGLRVDASRLGLALCIVALAGVDVIQRELLHGQTDLVVLAGLLLTLRSLDPDLRGSDERWAAGLGLALSASVKFQSLVFWPLLAWRGRWRVLAWSATWLAVLTLLPALVLGWDGNLKALGNSLASLGSLAESDASRVNAIEWKFSLSIPSALAKHGLGPIGVALATLSMAGACVVAAWRMYAARGLPLFVRARTHADDMTLTLMEWLGFIVALLSLGPQTTKRHLVLALPLFVLAGVMLVSFERVAIRVRVVVLAGLMVFVLGLYLPPRLGGMEALAEWWRTVGGRSWCLLAFYFAVLWGVLASMGGGSITRGDVRYAHA